MKNYYEILEVSENASPEVIEKAYKALVKKYHPDLQPNEKKQEAENKIKIINEAYAILSHAQKKETYDRQLKLQKIKEEQLKNKNTQKNYSSHPANQNTQKKVIKNPTSINYEDVNQQNEYNQVMQNAYHDAYQKAYQQAYINNLKNMGYQIKYEKTFQEKIRTFLAAVLTIIFLLIVGFILWQIPFIRNYFIDLYHSNEIFKILVDLINNIWTSFVSLLMD